MNFQKHFIEWESFDIIPTTITKTETHHGGERLCVTPKSIHCVLACTSHLLLNEGHCRRGDGRGCDGCRLPGMRRSLQSQTLLKLISLVRFGVEMAHCPFSHIYSSFSSSFRLMMRPAKGSAWQPCVDKMPVIVGVSRKRNATADGLTFALLCFWLRTAPGSIPYLSFWNADTWCSRSRCRRPERT